MSGVGRRILTEPIRQVVILVGGKGSRLGEITRETPKPLLRIDDDRMFLDYLIESVARRGYENILLLAGYLGGQVFQTYHNKKIGGAVIQVMCEYDELGTAGALTLARDILDPEFLVMNGDALFDFNLRSLECFFLKSDAAAALALRYVDDVSRYGRVVEEGGIVSAFMEKDVNYRGAGLISGGVYAMRRDILSLIDQLPCSMERDVFPRLVREKKVISKTFDGYFLDIGVMETLEEGRRTLPATRFRPAAFLDRDGVINQDAGYTHRVEDLVFIPGAREAILRLNDLGYYVFVVSNQAGIARGLYGLDEVELFHREIRRQLACVGASIDEFYISPFHPDGIVPQFSIDHPTRKPNPGMILKALESWPVILQKSFLIGDKDSDIVAASRAGIHGSLFLGTNLNDHVAEVLDKIG